ncbi:manganese efflux pump [Clostridium sp. D2Q-11]|uniref:Manganese efflux pump n=1 Tax=Anaeromonas frigoriresistens TaxID=2683708 RepID=A0A942UUD4_9FIRM|nr:manganese efflux pump [Anaeromonas frigoriresistens]MBS4538170.1 manganese efflux pump [Anaeromonas frigoriresistens]
MTVLNIIIISIALALDASGVALSIGIDRRIKDRDKIFFIINFGFFQFLLAFLGGYFGCLFNFYVFKLPSVMGGVIIAIVGIFMIKEGFTEEAKIDKFTFIIKIFIGISVSIDAFVVGFSSFNYISSIIIIINYSIIIGLITAFMTSVSFNISTKISKIKFVREYADFLGGIILILFGIKMIFF